MTIKEALAAAGMTQTELASLTGINLRQIQKMCSGESSLDNVATKNMSAICEALGVSMGELSSAPSTVRILRMRDVMTKEAYEGLTTQERRALLKVEQAKEYSGWRGYPDTCRKLIERIPEDWWGKYSAQHIGEVMALLKAAYDDGVDSHRFE